MHSEVFEDDIAKNLQQFEINPEENKYLQVFQDRPEGEKKEKTIIRKIIANISSH